MTDSTLKSDTYIASLMTLLNSEVVVRYSVRRPHRDCNYETFFAEVVDLYYHKKTGKYILTHLQFNVRVGLHVEERKNIDDPSIPEATTYEEARAKGERVFREWKNRPAPWRTSEQFAGMLHIGEDRDVLPETAFLFFLYHGRIDAVLEQLRQETYNTGGGGHTDEWSARYQASQQLYGRFSAFAATSHVRRVVQALTTGAF